MLGSRVARGWIGPVVVWMIVLSLTFASEFAVMHLLPRFLPEHPSRTLEAAVDAVVLTLLLAPVLWWTLVRPLREVIRLRARFLADLFAQIEADRRQTARELHDGVGQALTLLISGLRSANCCRAVEECAGRVNGFQRLAENALAEVRRLSLGLRPSLLDDLGLAAALERLVEDIRAHHPIDLSLDVAGVIGVRLPESVATAAFRIAQEALSNVVQHSRARRAAVAVRRAGRGVVVEVSDDGSGIDAGRLRDLPAGHLGLRGMRERAALLGGDFSLDTGPGRGTRVAAALPAEGGGGE